MRAIRMRTAGLGACLAILLLLCARLAFGGTGFLIGADVSALPRMEELGTVYKRGDRRVDAIEEMRANGANLFRARLFVEPTRQGLVVQDLAYVTSLARRIKSSGAALLLTLHYSDTWTNPGNQEKPKSWQELDFDALKQRVAAYTRNTLQTLDRAGAYPDFLEIGNEIRQGMLWPEGRLDGSERQWQRFAQLLKSAIDAARTTTKGRPLKIVIHVHGGENKQRTLDFFAGLERQAVPYDIIGLSYYPWWGAIENLRETLDATARRFGRDIFLVETAYLYKPHWDSRWKNSKLPWPATPEGQQQYLKDVVSAVKAAPDGRGTGVLWWFPESRRTKGQAMWLNGSGALFGEDGQALPALLDFGKVRAQP